MINHRLLHRMQVVAVFRQRFNRYQFLAIECRQKLNTGIDRPQGNVIAVAIQFRQDDGTRTAIAFGTAFLGSGSVEVFTKKLQDRPCWIDI